MNKEKFVSEICRLMQVDPQTLQDDTPMGKDHGMDSMDATEAVYLAEEELGVSLTWAEVDSIENFGDLRRAIEAKGVKL